MQQRRVVFVIFKGFQSLDLAGAYEVFQQAGRHSAGYACEVRRYIQYEPAPPYLADEPLAS